VVSDPRLGAPPRPTADEQVHFTQIDERTRSRVRHERVAEKTGREVPEEGA
jgi:non-homologous end joining protein Ku